MAPQYHYKTLNCGGDLDGAWWGLVLSVACLPSDEQLLVSGTTLQVCTAPSPVPYAFSVGGGLPTYGSAGTVRQYACLNGT